jgi:hypothetical protein
MASSLNPPLTHAAGGRGPSGWTNAVSRRNQMLPGDWTQLSEGDLRRISLVIEQHLSGRATLATIEACFMVRALLTTGRSFEELYEVTAYKAPLKDFSHTDLPRGLIMRDGKWSWWLPAGAPKTASAQADHRMNPVSDNVWLPLSVKTRAVLRDVR